MKKRGVSISGQAASLRSAADKLAELRRQREERKRQELEEKIARQRELRENARETYKARVRERELRAWIASGGDEDSFEDVWPELWSQHVAERSRRTKAAQSRQVRNAWSSEPPG